MNKDLLRQLQEALQTAASEQSKNRDYAGLISLAYHALYELQVLSDDLEDSERITLYGLISMLHDVTSGMEHYAQKYAEEHIHNTCDYKIARELVFGFLGNDPTFLRQVMNHYYYDGLLVYRASEQLIELEGLLGLYKAMTFAQSTSEYTKLELLDLYFGQLKEHVDDPAFTFKNVGDIASNSLMPLYIRKEMAAMILRKNMLDDQHRNHYMELYTTVLFPARDEEDLDRLSKEYFQKA